MSLKHRNNKLKKSGKAVRIPMTNVSDVEIAEEQNLQELVDATALKTHMKPQPSKTRRSIQSKGEMDRTVNSRHFKRPKSGDS